MNLYKRYDNKEMVLSAVCGLELIVTFIWLIIGIIFRDGIAKILGIPSTLVCCLFFYCMFQSAFQCWSLYKRYIYDYRKIVVATLINTLGASVLGVLSVLFISATASARAVSSVIVLSIIGIIIYISVFKNSHCFFKKDVWLFALSFCLPLMPHYLSEFVLNSSDKIMINYMCGANDVAIYSVAYSVGSLINLITHSINSSFAPYQYQKINAGEYDKLAKRANQVLLFVGIMLIGIMLFSREIVLIFGGYKYIDSVQVIIPICLGVYFNYMFQLFARVQEYYEHKLTVVIPSVLCAALNLVLNYIYINKYGYQAAAYTTFACYLIFCIIHYFFYKRVCKMMLDGKELYNIKGLALISLFVIGSGIVVSIISKYIWLKYSLLAIAVVLMIVFRNTIKRYMKNILSKV